LLFLNEPLPKQRPLANQIGVIIGHFRVELCAFPYFVFRIMAIST